MGWSNLSCRGGRRSRTEAQGGRSLGGPLVVTLLELDRLDPQLALEVGLVAKDAGKYRLGLFAAHVPVLDVPGEGARDAVEDHRTKVTAAPLAAVVAVPDMSPAA
jgi:hypothetical protein